VAAASGCALTDTCNEPLLGMLLRLNVKPTDTLPIPGTDAGCGKTTSTALRI